MFIEFDVANISKTTINVLDKTLNVVVESTKVPPSEAMKSYRTYSAFLADDFYRNRLLKYPTNVFYVGFGGTKSEAVRNLVFNIVTEIKDLSSL